MKKRRLWVVEVWSGSEWVPYLCEMSWNRENARVEASFERDCSRHGQRYRVVPYEPSR